jgi:hypothetical protein
LDASAPSDLGQVKRPFGCALDASSAYDLGQVKEGLGCALDASAVSAKPKITSFIL